ncbi:hypothetical protein MKX01_017552, partial [Papaver californicum]
VHALSNVCHADIERISKRRPGEVSVLSFKLPPHEPEVGRNAFNHFLLKYEGDGAVVDVRYIPADFHARHKAPERTSWQLINILPFACMWLLHSVSTPYCPSKVERDQANPMEQDPIVSSSTSGIDVAGKALISNNDKIGGFNAAFGEEFGRWKIHRCYVITARARAFLYHQVSLLVGVLKAAGTGEITISDVERILNAKTVTATSAMAPAHGLYLARVKYKLP